MGRRERRQGASVALRRAQTTARAAGTGGKVLPTLPMNPPPAGEGLLRAIGRQREMLGMSFPDRTVLSPSAGAEPRGRDVPRSAAPLKSEVQLPPTAAHLYVLSAAPRTGDGSQREPCAQGRTQSTPCTRARARLQPEALARAVHHKTADHAVLACPLDSSASHRSQALSNHQIIR